MSTFPIALALLSLSLPALSHGGVYAGPGVTVPPTSDPSTGPADTAPTASTPSPGGSGSSPVFGGGSSPASTAPLPSPSNSAGSAPTFDMTHWGLWWRFNKESLLDLRMRFARGKVWSADGPFGRPAESLINDRVLPILFASMEDESYDGLISGSIVALGRIGSPQDAKMAAAFERAFFRKSGEVRETAALGLGLLGEHNGMDRLAKILAEPKRTKEELGYVTSDHMRAYAAYSLGFLASRNGISDVKRMAALNLLDRISDAREDMDVRVASLNAIGMVDLPWSGPFLAVSPTTNREGLVQHLIEIYSKGIDEPLMAHLPVAIARLLHGAPTGLRQVVTSKLLDRWSPRLDRHEAAALVLAYGECEANWESELGQDVTRLLAKIATTGDTSFPRRLAMVSLGKLASRPTATGSPDPIATAYFETFLIKMQKVGRSADRPWIGLAASVYNAGLLKHHSLPSAELLAMLRHLIEKGGSIDTASTAAFAVGLAEDHASGPFLAKQLAQASNSSLRGFLATAIGLVGYQEAKPLLIETIEKVRFSPVDLENTAIGLALLDQAGTAERLRAMLGETNLTSLAGSLAYTLGRISDASAIPQIAKMYTEKTSGLTRTYIIIALGLACEDGRLPWFVELSEGSNYAAWSPSLFDSAGKGVLNLF